MVFYSTAFNFETHSKNVKCGKVIATLIGLSKERPILGNHPKAHILDFMKSGRFQVKSDGFHMDFMKSGGFQVKSTGFHT